MSCFENKFFTAVYNDLSTSNIVVNISIIEINL